MSRQLSSRFVTAPVVLFVAFVGLLGLCVSPAAAQITPNSRSSTITANAAPGTTDTRTFSNLTNWIDLAQGNGAGGAYGRASQASNVTATQATFTHTIEGQSRASGPAVAVSGTSNFSIVFTITAARPWSVVAQYALAPGGQIRVVLERLNNTPEIIIDRTDFNPAWTSFTVGGTSIPIGQYRLTTSSTASASGGASLFQNFTGTFRTVAPTPTAASTLLLGALATLRRRR